MRAPSNFILPARVRDLSFAADGAALLKDVSFDLAPQGLTVILGPNGAGKSLLLRLLHGLLPPAGGKIEWSAPDPGKRQAMLFQRPVLLRRSAAANLDYALAVKDVPKSARPRLIAEALEMAGLGHIADRPARVLSGGEQQRLALARAWSLKPELLFLDEPTASLDPGATRQVEELIVSIKARGTKIVMTTHDLGEAKRLADDVLFLARGRLVEAAPAGDFFAHPKSADAAAFLAGNLLW